MTIKIKKSPTHMKTPTRIKIPAALAIFAIAFATPALGYLTAEQFDQWVVAKNMTHP